MVSGLVGAKSEAALTAQQLIKAYATGQLSPVEVTQTLLDAIADANDQLGAFVAINTEGALRSAQDAERQWSSWRKDHGQSEQTDWQQLPSWGLPVSVKDTIEMAGMPTTYGSLAFAEHYKPDSPLVTKLRAAGSVILGKTNTSEFALSMVTATRQAAPARNPYDLSRTAGGSSGGAAAATSAGFGILGLGTDSVGSIRQPAAYCGLYGLKPTFGRVKNPQTWRASPVRSHLGPLVRHEDDLVYSWRVLTGDHQPISAITPSDLGGRLRVASLLDDPDDGAVLSEGLGLLQQLGFIETVPKPLRLAEPPNVHSTDGDWIFAADHYAAAEKLIPGFMDANRDKLTDYARRIYETGPRIPAWEYRRLAASIEDYRETSQEIFTHTDLIVTSVAGKPPVLEASGHLGDLGPEYPNLSVWNLAGNPAITIPLKRDKNGLPRSIQLVARHGEDRLLIALAISLAQVVSPVMTSSQ